jgi:hypothetical protein
MGFVNPFQSTLDSAIESDSLLDVEPPGMTLLNNVDKAADLDPM